MDLQILIYYFYWLLSTEYCSLYKALPIDYYLLCLRA